MFPSDPIIDDGFRITELGNIRLRVNVDHIQHCCTAIRRRWKNESQHTLDDNNVVSLTYVRKRGRVKT